LQPATKLSDGIAEVRQANKDAKIVHFQQVIRVLKDDAWDWISKNSSEMIKVSDKVWEFAELGLVEAKSAALLAMTLEEHGFKVQREIAGMPTAFMASYGSGNPVIGVMGEYDALPGLSQKAVPYKEPLVEGAPGHGCGHNIHGVSGMAGAIAAKETMMKNGIKGTVRFFGCPAEESYSGKVFMVRDGFFNDVDATLSHHTSSFNVAGVGSTLAVNSAKFHFYGVTAHAAGTPFLGKSALDAVELMNVGVNFMREHMIQEARVHYVIEIGGLQPNVVPDYARSWYFVRAPERVQVEELYNWVLKIAEGASMMARTTLKAEQIEGIYNVLPSKRLSEIVTTNMREIGAPEYDSKELKFMGKLAETISKEDKRENLRMMKRPAWEELMDVNFDQEIHDPWDEGEVWPGSTDVSDVSWVTPTIEFTTAAGVLGSAGHAWQDVACHGMGIGHKSLIFAAKIIAGSALDLLTKPELLKKVKDEFEDRKKGQKYVSPIPKDLSPPLEIAREQARTQGG
jgi:aminobenzoyl-glutamate utilization protein B